MLSNRVFSLLATFPNTTFRRFLQQQGQKIVREKIQPNELLWKSIENKSIKSPKDWKIIRSEILNADAQFTVANIDSMTIGVCTSMKKYELALSYLEFLKQENLNINLATLGKYFKLLYLQEIEHSVNNEDKILSLYDSVRKSYPILDAITLDNVVQALSITKNWKLTVKLLEEIKITTIPTSNAYSAVISAAFSNNNDDLAWKLMDEMIDNNKVIQEGVYVSYLKKQFKNLKNDVEKLFKFLQERSINIDNDSMDVIVEVLKSLKLKLGASTIYAKGICKCCNNKLKSFELTDEEFTNLKTKILQNVLVGKDVFNKTTPEELYRFKNFIANIPKFDIIIDGLNVAYSAGVKHSAQVTSGLVAAVVSHFASQGKKVLVCGRKHMSRWPKENWDFIQENSTIFLTEDLSQDDPYLLYCALNSGKDTIIVTRDLMRGHKFLLKDLRQKVLFDRWLAQRQWFLVRVQDRSPIFKKPLAFTQIAQEIDGYWHLPFVSKTNPVKVNWLCIKLM